MAENTDLKQTEHELDVNENPSVVIFNSSNITVADNFTTSKNESQKYLSESQNLTEDVLNSSNVKTPKKNALTDSGFHCENLDKIVLPDLVNNSLCERVDNEFINSILNGKQISGVSFCSSNDNSYHTSKDESLDIPANTTTSEVEFLLERLTLNSTTTVCDNLENSLTSAIPDEKLKNNFPISSEVFNENLGHPDLLNVAVDSDGSKLESSDVSISSNQNLQQPSAAAKLNKVPFEEVITEHNSVEKLSESSCISELNKMHVEKTVTDLNVENSPVPSLPKLNETSPSTVEDLDEPSSVPELNRQSLDKTSFSLNMDARLAEPSVPELNKVPLEGNSSSNTVEGLGESSLSELNKPSLEVTPTSPNAVSGLAEPSSVPELNKQSFDKNSTSENKVEGEVEPSSVSELNNLPLDESCKVPQNASFTDANSVDMSLTLNSDAEKISSGCLFSSETALGDAFKRPLSVSDSRNVIGDGEVFIEDSGNNLDGEEFQDAVQFFKDPSNFQIFENTSSTSSNRSMPRDSLYIKFDPLYKKVVQPKDVNEDLKEDVEDENSVKQNSIVNACGPIGENLVSFDSPMRTSAVVISEDSNKDLPKEIGRNLEELTEKVSFVEEHDEGNQQFSNKHFTNVSTRASLIGNLLSFDSPVRSISARNSKNLQVSPVGVDQKLYTEEEFQHALKIYELQMQETFLKKQKESEENFFKKQKESEGIFLKKQKELEEDILKKQKENEESLKRYQEMENNLEKQKEEAKQQQQELEREVSEKQEKLQKDDDSTNKLQKVTEMCSVLRETMSEFAAIAFEQNCKHSDLSAKIATLEAEKQKLESDLKTSTEDLQNVEKTFSDFHRRYGQCKDMLKTFKENEDRFKSQVECLNKRIEELEQMNDMLQTKNQEVVNKANTEVANAKKGGDAQLAVLRAQLKKSELKVSSLESDLKQVRIENDKLSNICDDLMAKVSEA